MTAKPPEVRLEVSVRGESVAATLTYTNRSSEDAYVEIINGCLDGKIGNDVFEITSGGREVEYTGAFVKRPPPGPDDFAKISPRGELKTTVILDDAYAFPPGEHTFRVVYAAFHSHPHDKDYLEELRSNVVEFSLKR